MSRFKKCRVHCRYCESGTDFTHWHISISAHVNKHLQYLHPQKASCSCSGLHLSVISKTYNKNCDCSTVLRRDLKLIVSNVLKQVWRICPQGKSCLGYWYSITPWSLCLWEVMTVTLSFLWGPQRCSHIDWPGSRIHYFTLQPVATLTGVRIIPDAGVQQRKQVSSFIKSRL